MRRLALTAAVLSALPMAALASETWDYIQDELYGDRTLRDGQSVIAIDAPARTDNDSRTQIAAHIIAPAGLRLGAVTVVLDENPMPVSAVFDLENPQESFFFDVTMRINGPTPLHVVAETTDGQLWMAESFVKTSGQGACAAPPGSSPVSAIAAVSAVARISNFIARSPVKRAQAASGERAHL